MTRRYVLFDLSGLPSELSPTTGAVATLGITYTADVMGASTATTGIGAVVAVALAFASVSESWLKRD